MKKLKNVLLNNIDLLLFIIIMSIKFLVYGSIIQENYFSASSLYPPVFTSLIVICSIALLFKKKYRTLFLYIVDVLLSILIVSDTVYFGYYRDILSIPVIQNGMLLGPVKASVISLFKIKYLLFFLDFIIIPKLIYKIMPEKDNTLKLRLISFAVLLLIGAGGDANYIYKLSVEQPNLITTMYNRIYIAEHLGNLNFHVLDTYNSISRAIQKGTKLSADKENELKKFFASNTTTSENPKLKGTGEGKNLIIIQVEALQQFVINRSINGQEITPNLNAWLKKSAYFDNYFYQVAGGNTSDAELMTNNSVYPAAAGAAAYLYCGNQFNSLPKALDDKGYTSIALHGFKEDFWNRSVMNKAEGFDTFYGQSSFKLDEIVGMGLSDKSFLNQSVDILKKQKQPFYSFLVTLSSHFPFDDTKHYGDFNVGEYDGSLLGDYLKSIHYADEQLGMFLKELDEAGLTKNSIIALYGDHYAIPKSEEKNLYKFLGMQGSELNWALLQKVPMIMHFPGDQNSGVYHNYSGEMDLYPTIANLYNLPTKYMFGKDLFNPVNDTVILRNGSFTDGNIFYLSQYNKYYDVKTGALLSETQENKTKRDYADKMLEYSDDVLNHNLLEKFDKEN
ncbi:LTA synthase family protein [Clostridium sp. 19966]|uniref:LTA synthase family protein n=1 Tax=Clostridium sp. 19966 TaxID=2768166 RepID=UPI0028DDD915|nr:LTA synthase family protein [Clostridium sp. 19966]MDT8717978.1 LTA synthase family protein [Clostridium sp. 19966]